MTVTFVIFIVLAGIQLFYYLFFYLAPALQKHGSENNEFPPVSVIICARNEAENLKKFLPEILGQDYPTYEVIVVNDSSEDDTYRILGEYIQKYPHLKVTTVNKDHRFDHGKKFAQFIGIKAAKYDILLFTDADCYPVSNQWIKRMASNFKPQTEFVLGYGGYIPDKGLLNLYQRYETLFIAMQYTGMAIRGIPYMGVGRNLAYRKNVFFLNKGFGRHFNLASGDDDLFVNKNARLGTVSVEINQEAHIRSIPATDSITWMKRKIRHMSTAKYYKPLHKLLLLIEPFSRIAFYVLFIYLISSHYLMEYVLGIFILRFITLHGIFYLNSRKFNENGIIKAIFLFDIFSPVINLILYSGVIRSKNAQKAWK